MAALRKLADAEPGSRAETGVATGRIRWPPPRFDDVVGGSTADIGRYDEPRPDSEWTHTSGECPTADRSPFVPTPGVDASEKREVAVAGVLSIDDGVADVSTRGRFRGPFPLNEMSRQAEKVDAADDGVGVEAAELRTSFISEPTGWDAGPGDVRVDWD